jgi:SPP1 family predicted phage head-tail adaptor
MRVGQMDRQISLFHRSIAATDANGTAAQTFPTAYATVWAQKIDAGGREYFAGDQDQAELAVRFKIRYRSDVLATDRITFEGLSLNITHIQELGRREALMLFATAIRT